MNFDPRTPSVVSYKLMGKLHCKFITNVYKTDSKTMFNIVHCNFFVYLFIAKKIESNFSFFFII